MPFLHAQPRLEQIVEEPDLPPPMPAEIDDYGPPPSEPQQDADDPASADGTPGFPVPGSES